VCGIDPGLREPRVQPITEQMLRDLALALRARGPLRWCGGAERLRHAAEEGPDGKQPLGQRSERMRLWSHHQRGRAQNGFSGPERRISLDQVTTAVLGRSDSQVGAGQLVIE
jgi:hypothetical protein